MGFCVFVEKYRWQRTRASFSWTFLQSWSPKHWIIINCHIRIPPRCKLGLCSLGILSSVGWQFITDVSGQPIGSIFKGQWEILSSIPGSSINISFFYLCCWRGSDKFHSLRPDFFSQPLNIMISNTEHRIASRNCLTFGDGTDRASRNVGKNYHSILRKIPNESRYQLL